MMLLKNKPIFIAIIALSIITVTAVIALEESISVSDRVETEGIPVTSNNEPITSSSSIDTIWSGDLTLTLSNLPALGETAEVVLVVNNTSGSTLPASYFATVMSLSEHFEVLNPPSNIQLSDNGGFFITEPMSHDIQPNEILTMNWTIRAVEEGEAEILNRDIGDSFTIIRLVIGAEETLLKEDFDRLYPPQRPDPPPQGSYPNHFTRDEDPNKVVDNSVVVLITDDQIREEIERISEKIEQMGYDDDDVIHDVLVRLKELLANSTSTEDSDLEKQSFLDSILPKAYASTPPTFTLIWKNN